MTKRFTLLLLVAGLAACGTPQVRPAGAPAPAQLAECGSSPHCVSSLATDAGHQVAALKLKQLPGTAWPAIVAAVRETERATVVQGDAHYLHAEIVSPWHFYIDDLELMLRNDGRVDVRSSSRVGYYDFGVNRKRVEALREKLAAQGVVARAAR